MNRVDVYVQRMLDASASTCYGYSADVMLKSEKGWMVMAGPIRAIRSGKNQRKQTQWTRCGRFETYRIEPEAIEYGENFVVHREGPEATPYLPNAIMSSNPYVRPDDYGIPITAQHHDDKHVRNIKLPWRDQAEPEPVVGEGVSVLLRDPEDAAPGAQPVVGERLGADLRVELRRSVPMDKRTPGVGEHQLHINPQAAKDRGINDGDYVYVDGNPVDRPYRGWKPSDPFYKVARLMIR